MQFRELTDRYQLQKILKSTRFGTVLQATDTRTGRTVAVKLITVPPSPGLQAGAPAFQKLAVTLAGMQHPNLPTVLDFGFTADGSAFLALELLEGKTLDTLSGLPPARSLGLVAQALSGFEALASRGIPHHNLSPDNLLVQPDGQVKVLGLGTAIFRPRGPESAALGLENARFRAPELNEGAPADWRADLFSLALTACSALGANVGFGDTPVVQLPLAVSFELENDEALRQGLERSLRRQPAERPTPPQLREALRLAVGGAAAPPAPQPQPQPAPQPVIQPSAKVTPFPTPPSRPPATVPAPAPAIPLAAPLSLIPPAAPAAAASAPPMMSIPTATVSGGRGAAELLADLEPLDDKAPEGDLLSAVDDEVLNALLSVPPPSPRPPGAQGNVVPFPAGGAATAAAPAAPAKAPSLLGRPAVLAGVGGVVVLLGLAGFWFLSRPEPQPVAAATPAGPVLPAAFDQAPSDRLEEAAMLLAQGEDAKARRVLRSIAFGEQGLLSPAACRTLASIEENLNLAGLERLPAALAAALRAGDFEALQSAVEVGAGQEAGMAPEVRADFDRARTLVDAYAQALTASARGDHAGVLDRFATLQSEMPKLSDPEDLRGKAAVALEAQAEALVQEARYDEALARLAPIGRTWSDRPGFKDRIERYQKYKASEQEQETLLATLPSIERRNRPHEGLEALAAVDPTPHLAPRFAEARGRLEDLLSRLDKQPPEVVLRDGYFLQYSRGTVAELSFRAKDDYQVKDVKILGKPEGGKFRELPVEKTRTGYYTVEIAPDFHQNGTVQIYVVATDLSGRETYLGTRDKPMELKRQQGFERLIR